MFKFYCKNSFTLLHILGAASSIMLVSLCVCCVRTLRAAVLHCTVVLTGCAFTHEDVSFRHVARCCISLHSGADWLYVHT